MCINRSTCDSVAADGVNSVPKLGCRTVADQSYMDPAERVISELNTGLQIVSLAREKMECEWEQLLSGANSMKAIRERSATEPAFLVAWMESTKACR